MAWRINRWGGLGFALALTPATAWANFPPVAQASAAPLEALLGQSISFSSADSFDPDEGPDALSYSWDFGDGTTSDLAAPVHTFAELGLHVVTLVVSDGAAQSLVSLDVVMLPVPTPQRARSSGPIALDAAGTRLAVANTDSDSISWVDTSTLAVTETPVCAAPRNVAWAREDSVVLVTCFDSDELWAIDADSLELLNATPTGRQPFGVVEVPGSGEVMVAHYGVGQVSIFDPTLAVRDDIAVGRGPRSVAVTGDGATAWVTHLLADADHGHVSRLDVASRALLDDVELADDPGPDSSSSGRGVPTVLSAVAIDPSQQTIWVGGIKANTHRGPSFDGQLLEPRNRLRGVLAPISVETGAELIEQRLDTNDADGVSALAFSPLGRYAYLTHQGAAALSVYDVVVARTVDTSTGNAVDEEARVETGAAPDGVVVSPDGTRVYVHEALSRSVAVFDVQDPASPVALAQVTVTEEALSPTLALGKAMFFSSREPVHSDQNYIACASCHPDGGEDGRVWDFTQYGEGRRNTIDLRGRAGTGHGPVHWTANFDEIADFENDIQGGFGGEGFLAPDAPHAPLAPESNAGRSEGLDALAAYVSSLTRVPRSPHREAAGGLSRSAQRGFAIFFDETVGCADCHTAPRFTDSTLREDPADYVRHDVGTARATSGQGLGAPLVGFDTPTLLGVWTTAPYLHDGRAPTLLEVLTTENPDDQHGVTSHLSDGDLDDLVAFLLSLQGEPDEYPELPPGETGGGSESSTGGDSTGTGTTLSGTTAPGTSDTSEGSDAGDASSSGGASAAEGDDGCACGSKSNSPPSFLWAVLCSALFARRRRV